MAAAPAAAGRARHARPLPQRPSVRSRIARTCATWSATTWATSTSCGPRARQGRAAAAGARKPHGDPRRPGGRPAQARATARSSCSSRTVAAASNARSSPRPGRVRAAADPRPHPGGRGRPARGRVQRRLRAARAPLLGLRAGSAPATRSACRCALDLRAPGTLERVDALLARHRPGRTPLRAGPAADRAARRRRHARSQRRPARCAWTPNCPALLRSPGQAVSAPRKPWALRWHGLVHRWPHPGCRPITAPHASGTCTPTRSATLSPFTARTALR